VVHRDCRALNYSVYESYTGTTVLEDGIGVPPELSCHRSLEVEPTGAAMLEEADCEAALLVGAETLMVADFDWTVEPRDTEAVVGYASLDCTVIELGLVCAVFEYTN
jgi:hypothetical protein